MNEHTHVTGYIWIKDSSRPIFVEDYVRTNNVTEYIQNMEQMVSDQAKRAETHSIRIGSLVVLTSCIMAIKMEVDGRYPTSKEPVSVSI